MMVSQAKSKPGRFTYADYLGWSDDERWELIDGEAWCMSPSPVEIHQRISGNFYVKISNHLVDKPCRVYAAPLDVVFSEHDVVQPDILVVCDRSKITQTHVDGAPDLIIEILSPSTAAKDRKKKFDLYEKHGVREYLIVHPEEQFVEQFALEADGRYGRPTVLDAADTYKSAIFPGLDVDLASVFR